MKAQNKETKEIFHVFALLHGNSMIIVKNGINEAVEMQDYTLMHCPDESKGCKDCLYCKIAFDKINTK